MNWIVYLDNNGTIISVTEQEPMIGVGETKVQVEFELPNNQKPFFYKYDGNNVAENEEDVIDSFLKPFLIQDDIDDKTLSSINLKDINYKISLKDGLKYYAEHIFNNDGLLERTKYWKDYINPTNKGILVLEVIEIYVKDDSEDIHETAKQVVSRSKSWDYYKKDGSKETLKTKGKEYGRANNDATLNIIPHTDSERSKQNKEGKRRRDNVIDVLSNNVGKGGVLSGAFASRDEAYTKMSDFFKLYSGSFSQYNKTGRGDIFNDILNDSTPGFEWLDAVVPNNATTQALIPQMIGISLRTYCISKLKGDIS